MPQLHPETVERPRLISQLATSTAPLWLISAPGGYGKTTLALQALTAVDARPCWVNLDSSDTDPVRFWAHVCAALIHDEDRRDQLLEDLTSTTIGEFVDALIATVEQEHGRVLLVLDDFHLLSGADVLDPIKDLLAHPPANLTLAITTRIDPPLPIPKLRTMGEVVELRLADLAFGADETAKLLGDAAQSIDVASLMQQSEGWVTALRVAAIAANSTLAVGRNPSPAAMANTQLNDYLASEVFGHQPHEVQRFLLESSLLEELEPSLCDAITGRPGSLSILRSLHRDQLFLQLLDAASSTYRYHPVFLNFLRHQAKAISQNRRDAIHKSAAQWFASHERPTQAIAHATAAKLDEVALELIRSNFVPYSQQGRFKTVDGWLERYGIERCRQDPQLAVTAAWVALNRQRYEEIGTWLDGVTEPPRPLLQEMHSIRSHHARHVGRLGDALAAGLAAQESLDDHNSAAASVVFAALGQAQALAGAEATASLTQAVSLGETHNIDSSTVIGYSYLALVASCDAQRLEEADALADQALGYIDSPTLERFHQPSVAFLVKSRAALARGEINEAMSFADVALDISVSSPEPLIELLVRCQLARILHLQGNLTGAREKIREARTLITDQTGDHIVDMAQQARVATRYAPTNQTYLNDRLIELTKKETQIVQLLPRGLNRKKFAEQLHISENTLKSHLTSIRHKLGVEPRGDLAQRAAELGLLDGAELTSSPSTQPRR